MTDASEVVHAGLPRQTSGLRKLTRPITTMAMSLAIASPLFAGTATIQSSDGSTSTFEYNGDMLRMGMPGSEGYAIARDGTFYVVTNDNGNLMVIDAGSMMRTFAGAAMDMAPAELNSEVISLKSTGRKETVAGIRGEVYELRFKDADGTEQREDMVLSSDPRALEFRDALFAMVEMFGDLANSQELKEAMKESADIKGKLASMNSGVLRFGSEMSVTNLDGQRVDAARFELPAEPMNLEGIGALFGGMNPQAPAGNAGSATTSENGAGSEKKTGLFSSMMGRLGDKVNRQSDRVSGSVEREIDEVDAETDQKVDSAIDKAFGKLFGRN